MNREKFLKLLFDPEDLVGTFSHPYEVSVDYQRPTDIYFSINALSIAGRSDSNVTKYRNFLLELDGTPLDKQVALVTSRLPVSSIVFSGNKSYHFIISLEQPVATETEYRRVWQGLYEAVPEADKSTKNPSRLSRLPDVVRPDTGLWQELLYLGSRIKQQELPIPTERLEVPQKPKDVSKIFVTELLLKALEVGPDLYIKTHFSGRNQFFYWLGKRCSELGHSKAEKKKVVDKFYERLQDKRNFNIREAYGAARVVWK